MQVTWRELEIPGLLHSSPANFLDERGQFTKILSKSNPSEFNFVAREIYWTKSFRGVVRGFHLQLPPEATAKLVFVIQGSIRDFVLDTRIGSPTEGRTLEVQLGSSSGSLLVPVGCAHAYEVLEDDTIVGYAQDVPFGDPQLYAGIRADSAGVIPVSPSPIVAQRDLEFCRLEDFSSPFLFEGMK